MDEKCSYGASCKACEECDYPFYECECDVDEKDKKDDEEDEIDW